MSDKLQPLLSICIPTYNRAEVLKKTVKELLSLEAFDSEVELIVSDNASIDNTQEVVNELINYYKYKRIKYHKNSSNIRDLNFYTALSLGTGKYLKLLNDYTFVDNDILLLLKRMIKENENNETPLLFYGNLREKGLKIGDAICVYNIDKFQRCVNNKVTWISHFGCWRKDLLKIKKFNGNSNLQLLQMEWTLYLVENSDFTKIVNIYYKCFPLDQGKRSPYNFFTPHVVNYYKILNWYKNNKKISRNTIAFDKQRILSDFVGNKIVEYLILKQQNDFYLDGSWSIIIKHFYRVPYFYFLLLKGFLRKIKREVIR